MKKKTSSEQLNLAEKRALVKRLLARKSSSIQQYPVSQEQRRLWLLYQIQGPTPTYNMRYVLNLQGPLETLELGRALAHVVARHDSLRTVFSQEDETVHQLVHPEIPVALPLVDLSGLPHAASVQEGMVADLIRTPFHLEKGPLFRFALYRLERESHVLVLVFHHIITDGWSMGLFVNQAVAAYRALLAGKALEQPAMVMQYADYVARQQARKDDPGIEAHFHYWREHLAHMPSLLDIPTDRARPVRPSFRGAKHLFAVDASLSGRVRELARRSGGTLYMALLAAYGVLLARQSGQGDIVIGTPSANRDQADMRGIMGFFVRTLVMRMDLGDRPSTRELILRVRKIHRDAFAHADVAFERLVQELQSERYTDRHPLFQAMFVLQNAADETIHLPGLDVAYQAVDMGIAKFDLNLGITDTPEGFRAYWEYATDLFDASTVARFAQRFVTLLTAMTDQPDLPVDQLSLSTPSEHTQLLAWNQTRAPFPSQTVVHRLIEARAASTPQATALIVDEPGGMSQLTYGELNVQANRLARLLLAQGVGHDQTVGLCMERSRHLVVALLATLKAGAAYLPLDPEQPRARLEGIVADARPALVLTHGPTMERLPQNTRTLAVDRADIDHLRGSNLDRAVQPEQAIYRIYTSGSTGTPKGVTNTHGALCNRLHWMQQYFGLTPEDRVLQKTPYTFDVSAWEFFWPLMAGAGLVVAQPGGHLDTAYMVSLIDRWRVTTLHFVPSMLRFFLAEDPLPRTMQRVICSGEALSRELVNLFHERLNCGLFNLYGPTEAAIDVTCWPAESKDQAVALPIGRPIQNTSVWVLDAHLNLVPPGVRGELYLGGVNLARGYLHRPGLTALRFVPDPFATEAGARLYRTGDLGHCRNDGALLYDGRLDAQFKLRGLRVEMGEIEAHLSAMDHFREAVVMPRPELDDQLVAYVVPRSEDPIQMEVVRDHLRRLLPEYMVPASIIPIQALPVTANGKLNRKALPAPQRAETGTVEAPRNALEKQITAMWCRLLKLEAVGINQNFFDVGGHSLLLIQLHRQLKTSFPETVPPVVDLFQYPTIRDMARLLERQDHPTFAKEQDRAERKQQALAGSDASGETPARHTSDIAVVGLAARFPGAPNLECFWHNLVNGVSGITHYDSADLLAAGVPEATLSHPDYVKTGAPLDEIDTFDAAFFGITPREAQVTDPQRRLLLETAVWAMEDAGLVPGAVAGRVGVYVGIGVNSYLLRNLLPQNDLIREFGEYGIYLNNHPDFTATRLAYHLNLQGPAVTLATACSTSLVAVHEACKSLLLHESDVALAGGANVSVPHHSGYFHIKDGIRSPDGHCRAFDARAAGTVFGDGVGLTALMRLADAQAQRRHIYAVVRGSAVNNDGGRKMGFTAPSIEGQSPVISDAQAMAGIHPETISYIEAHGTGTVLGDPIEVAALELIFRAETEHRGFCALGSVKTSIGHLDAAAGIAGFIKTVLALRHKMLPASLNFEQPNPQIQFHDSPFYVNHQTRPWDHGSLPRRAGVSAFGIGGTNAHVVLEEAPATQASAGTGWCLLPLSARSPQALERVRETLHQHLETREECCIRDVAHTLQHGRAHHPCRGAYVAADTASALNALGQPPRTHPQAAAPHLKPVFLFPGQGTQYPGMTRELYHGFPVFRQHVDACLEILKPLMTRDPVMLLLEGDDPADLNPTEVAQPLLYTVCYGLARLWQSWGVAPTALIGHSVGEYVAATLGGTFTPAAALKLLVRRGALMAGLPGGAMAAVAISAEELEPLLNDDIRIAAVNGPNRCTVSGTHAAIDGLLQRLPGAKRLHTSHAFHSHMMEPIRDAFRAEVAQTERQPPDRLWFSNLSGHPITPEQATDPDYWADHLCRPVRFADAIHHLLEDPDHLFLEVGPGQSLTRLLGTFNTASSRIASCPPIPSAATGAAPSADPRDPKGQVPTLLLAAGRLWQAGQDLTWEALAGSEPVQFVPLPSYPFERKRHWIDAPAITEQATPNSESEPSWTAREEAPVEAEAPSSPLTGNALQQRIVAIWENLLGVSPIGADHTFFELGGDSLLATQMLLRLRQECGLEHSLETIFDGATPATLAESGSQNVHEQFTAITPVDRDQPLPLSFSQRRMWFLGQLDTDSAAYNLPAALRVEGPLRVDLLEEALNRLIQRQESLRTRFVDQGAEPHQVILPHQPFRLRLEPLVSKDPESEVRRRFAVEAQTPFNLKDGPLFRIHLLKKDDRTHYLLANMHHIISDGWSIGLFIGEMTALYRNLLDANHPGPPSLPVGYADFAVWQRHLHSGQYLEPQMAYWTQQLAQLPERLELPHDLPRPPVQTYAGATLPVHVNSTRTAALRTLNRRFGTTPFMSLFACYAVLLARYSNQRDLPVGTLIASRNRPETSALIGFFVNALVLRLNLDGNPTFSQVFTRMRSLALDAFAHQDVPFEKLVEELTPNRNLSHSPLFQALFVLQNAPEAALAVPDLQITHLPLESKKANYELSLYLTERSDGFHGHLEYNTDLFLKQTIARMGGHFQRLLDVMAADPDRPVFGFSLLDEGERHHQLQTLNQTAHDYPKSACFHHLFSARAERHPDRLAAIFTDSQDQRITHTYGQLERAANRLAHRLIETGVTPETLVPVLAHRSIDFLIAILGILKAGGAYVPLDPAHPVPRLRQVLEQIPCPLVIVERDFGEVPGQALGADSPVTVAWLDQWVAPGPLETVPPVALTPCHLAYLIYTSGSTGSPKGAMVLHRGMVNHLHCKWVDLAFSESDILAQNAPQSFDISIWQYLLPLLFGGRVVVVNDLEARDPDRLMARTQSEALTLLEVVPSMLGAMLESLERSASARPSFSALRCLVVTGEALPPELCRRWLACYPHIPLLNAYGPTECSDDVAHCTIARAPVADTTIMPIGKPVINTALYVLDAYGHPIPLGVAGELFVAGDGLGRGYHGAPGRTAQVFLPNPFAGANESGSRLYRTGDLVRYLPDGNLLFLGRVDHQVKLRGFRIELGEIEAALAAHPRVGLQLVMVREDVPGRKKLVAYVRHDSSDEAALEDLRNALRGFLTERLPVYMVPSAFVILPQFPLTPNGKIDRKALPVPAEDDLQNEETYVAPRSPGETLLAEIWAEMLGLTRVSIHDNFFALGGDSILGIRIMARANEAGLGLAAHQLFQHQTVAELAAQIKYTLQPHTSMDPVDPQAGTPLTSVQHQWLDRFEDGITSIRIPSWTWAQADALAERLVLLYAHHPILRSSFHQEEGRWHRRIKEITAVRLIEVDVTGLEEAALIARIEQRVAHLAATLSPQRGPFLAAALFSGAACGDQLLLVSHRCIMDDRSWAILLKGLKAESPPDSAAHLEDHPPADGMAVLEDGPVVPLYRQCIYLEASSTADLFHEIPRKYHFQPEDVLAAGLLQALRARGLPPTVALNGNRHSQNQNLGCAVDAGRLSLDVADDDPDSLLKLVKEMLRQEKHETHGNALAKLCLAQPPQGAAWCGSMSGDMPPTAEIPTLLAAPKEGRLAMIWSYDPRRYSAEEIRQLADQVRHQVLQLINHCMQLQMVGFTPSDFPDSDLSQDELDDLIEDLV